MSAIDLKQLTGFPFSDIVPSDPGPGNVDPQQKESFNNYMRQAQTLATDAGSHVPYCRENDISQLPPSQAESAPATLESTPTTLGSPPTDQVIDSRPEQSECQSSRLSKGDDNKENTNYTESDSKAESSPLKGEKAENKQQPPESANAVSETEKKEKLRKKEEAAENAPPEKCESQANQPMTLINPEAVPTKTSTHSQADASITENDNKLAHKQMPAVPKDTKLIVGPVALNEETSSVAETVSAPIAGDNQAAVSTALKSRTAKKNSQNNGKNAGALSIDNQETGVVLAQGKDESPAVKHPPDTSPRRHHVPRRSLYQHERKEPAAVKLSDVIGSPPVGKEAAAGVPSINTALQAGLKVQITLPKDAGAEKIVPAADMTSKGDADVSANAPIHQGSATAKTAATTPLLKAENIASQADQIRFMQRVERAFAALGDRGGSVRLKLSPPDLGSLRLEITVRKGVMKARIEAESRDAKNLLLENLPALRDRLAQQNIKIQQFDVDLRDPASGGTPQQAGHDAETNSRQGGYRAPQSQGAEKNGAAPPMGITHLKDHSGQLNVIV